MAAYYRRQAESLHEVLHSGPETERLKATDLLRSLISAIVLTPTEEELKIDVQCQHASLSPLRRMRKAPPFYGRGFRNLSLVAGTGFEPVTFRL
jgi:hypothetical protein